MKTINKTKLWKMIRIIFYCSIFFYGVYLIFTSSGERYITQEFLLGFLLVILGFFFMSSIYYERKELYNKNIITKRVERLVEKTGSASKEMKELVDLIKKT